MRKEYELLHHEMLQDIERCMQLPHPEKENAENCFWIARNYWEKLRDCIKEKGFKNEFEEIEFFRNIKPKFTSYIEYYVMLSEALQFAPGEIKMPEEIKSHSSKESWETAVQKNKREFWENEEKRYQRFYDKHAELIAYYESGKVNKDRIYFLRSNNELKNDFKLMLYDNDTEWLTYYEQIIRSWLAHRKFREYVGNRISQLQKTNFQR
ncbi:MAG TPA: RteC domain-containing protein [Chitinophagaceae bacterium]|nr:RteC domain-containing protein [Chitinophagaceae bacterium]